MDDIPTDRETVERMARHSEARFHLFDSGNPRDMRPRDPVAATLRALVDERDKAKINVDNLASFAQEWRARAEKAEVEVERLRAVIAAHADILDQPPRSGRPRVTFKGGGGDE